ncbi:ABC transporter, partial [Micromonospora tulbaghiae]
VTAAARARQADLPGALDHAVAATDLGMDRRPAWWRVVGVIQWVVTLAALAGLAWLVLGYALRLLGLPELEHPTLGVVPWPTVLLLGGLLAGLLVAAVTRPVVGWAARRARRRAEERLLTSVGSVGEKYVLDPVWAVLARYGTAREALREAGPR